MDELINSPYVLSAVKISNLLKGISSSKMLYELFEYCLDGFDFDAARSRYFLKGERGEEGRFLLPPDARTVIALGFYLLYSIDTKAVDFMSVLGNYFYADDVNSAYGNFAVEFLKPFKDNVLASVRLMIEGEREMPVAKVTKSDKKVLADADARAIEALLDQSKGVILQYRIEPKLKAELVVLYDNFKQAIFDGDANRVKIAFIGYKYAVLFHKRSEVGIEKIEKILSEAGII